jgi:hypothetical protein
MEDLWYMDPELAAGIVHDSELQSANGALQVIPIGCSRGFFSSPQDIELPSRCRVHHCLELWTVLFALAAAHGIFGKGVSGQRGCARSWARPHVLGTSSPPLLAVHPTLRLDLARASPELVRSLSNGHEFNKHVSFPP